jgi:hypothetical protein
VLPDERMAEAATAAVQEEFDEYGWGNARLFADAMLTEAFASLDREALVVARADALRRTGVVGAARERSEAVLRAAGLIA